MKEFLEYIFKDIFTFLMFISTIFLILMMILSFIKVITEILIPKMIKECINQYHASLYTFEQYKESKKSILKD